MNPTSRLLRQGSVYTLGTLLQLSAAALVVPLLTRLLSATEFGVVALAMTIQILLSQAVGGGLPTAITRAFFDGRGSSGREISRRLIISTVLLATGATAIVGLSAPLWIRHLAAGDTTPVAIAIVLAIPAAVCGSALALLRVQERAAAFLSITMLGSVGAQLTGLTALVSTRGGPVAYLVGYGAAVAGSAVVGLFITGSLGSRPASPRLLRTSLAIGLPAISINLSAFILSTGDRFVIQVMEGPAEVGRYQVAYALGTLALTFLSALNLAWLPITFDLTDEGRWPGLAATTHLVLQIAAMLCAAIALVAPIGLRIMAPASYETSELVGVSALVALAALPWAMILAAGQVLLWRRDMRPILWIAPVAAILNLLLAVTLLPPLGLTGVAVATLVALTFQAFLLYRAATRHESIPWNHRGMAISLALGMAAVSISLALPASRTADVVRMLAAAAVGVLAIRTIRSHFSTAVASEPVHAPN